MKHNPAELLREIIFYIPTINGARTKPVGTFLTKKQLELLKDLKSEDIKDDRIK